MFTGPDSSSSSRHRKILLTPALLKQQSERTTALHGVTALLYKDPSFPADSSEATGDALLGVYSRFSAGAKSKHIIISLGFHPSVYLRIPF